MAATDPKLDIPTDAVAGLPGDLAAALADPPMWDKRLLELALRWPLPAPDAPALPPAETLRVFLLTWDPFEWAADRPEAFATSTRRPDGIGLVLYLPYWQALALADPGRGGVAGVLGRYAESVLLVAAEHQDLVAAGDYAAAVHAGTAPGLLSRIPAQAAWPAPAVELIGDGWRDVQFDVLEDLAQDAFGPAELDRAPVGFEEAGDDLAGCPGCTGSPLSFPEGLKDAQTSICSVHRAEALKVITARLEAAKASNPAGWEGLLDAGRRLEEPHLPLGFGPRLVEAAGVEDPTAAELEAQADLVIEVARMTATRPDALRALAGHGAVIEGWLDDLPGRLEAAGLDQQRAAVAAAAAQLLAPAPQPSDEASSPATAPLGPPKPEPFRRGPRVGRNAPCPCGSGRKYKFCHGQA